MKSMNKGSQISRREFLIASAHMAGALTLGSLLNSCAPAATPQVEAPAATESTEPLYLFTWAFHPEIVSDNLLRYKEVYEEQNVRYETSATGKIYNDSLAAKIIGGELIDVFYINPQYTNRLYKAGYVRSLEDMPGVNQVKDSLYPIGVESMSGSDGKLIGLPYWAGPQQLVLHAGHMDDAGLKPPTTWDEFVDQCHELKGKGISQYPFLPQWFGGFGQIGWTLCAECFSEGDYLFEADGAPTFKDGGIALQKTLERWKYMWDEELVPPDILTIPGEGIAAYSTGQYTFHWAHEYDQKVFNDPEQSKLAGMCRNIEFSWKCEVNIYSLCMYKYGC